MESIIDIKNVHKRFGEREALAGISLTVNRGDVFGYLGANGAGKTTTIRILLDLISADEGSVTIAGRDAADPDARTHVGFVLDTDGLYDSMTAIENLEFYARLYGRQPERGAIQALLSSVGLANRSAEPVGKFSRGMRQRAALARALVHDPDLLILDEPMSGVDPPGQLELRGILRNLVTEQGKTILLSSHNLDEVQRLCNRIALIDEGSIRLQGNLQELLAQQGDGAVVVRTVVPPDAKLIEALATEPSFNLTSSSESRLEFKPTGENGVARIVSFLAARNVQIDGVERVQGSLEQIYARILSEREGTE